MQRGWAVRTVETLSSPQMWSLSYRSGTLLRKFRGKQMLLFSLKCKRPWIKSSALLLSGVKEPGHDKGDPKDDKSGFGCLLSQCRQLLSQNHLPKPCQKETMVLPVTCHQNYFTCISIMHKSEKKNHNTWFSCRLRLCSWCVWWLGGFC